MYSRLAFALEYHSRTGRLREGAVAGEAEESGEVTEHQSR